MPKSPDKADGKSSSAAKSSQTARKSPTAPRRDGLAKAAKELAKQVI